MKSATTLAPKPWCGLPDTSTTNPNQPLDLPCASFSPWDFTAMPSVLSPCPLCPGQIPLSKPSSLTELVVLSTILKKQKTNKKSISLLTTYLACLNILYICKIVSCMSFSPMKAVSFSSLYTLKYLTHLGYSIDVDEGHTIKKKSLMSLPLLTRGFFFL